MGNKKLGKWKEKILRDDNDEHVDDDWNRDHRGRWWWRCLSAAIALLKIKVRIQFVIISLEWVCGLTIIKAREKKEKDGKGGHGRLFAKK